jgi:hypothetical protein
MVINHIFCHAFVVESSGATFCRKYCKYVKSMFELQALEGSYLLGKSAVSLEEVVESVGDFLDGDEFFDVAAGHSHSKPSAMHRWHLGRRWSGQRSLLDLQLRQPLRLLGAHRRCRFPGSGAPI